MSDRPTVGAAYCVYEDSGFLAESIARIYPFMMAILILVNHKPWQGDAIPGAFQVTSDAVARIPDPENKINLVWGHWKDEAEQRNCSLKHMRLLECQFMFIIDDDEMYNRAELDTFIEKIIPMGQPAYLFWHQMYWKNRDTVIKGCDCAMPAMVSTEEGKVRFNEARAILVAGTWITCDSSLIVCHHFSYVRSDEKMLRKIRSFSHASSIIGNWYEDVWLKWVPGNENLHPTRPEGFPGTIPEAQAAHHLEKLP